MIETLRLNVHLIQFWIASKIVGFNIEQEINAAYEAGRQWGKIERKRGLPDD